MIKHTPSGQRMVGSQLTSTQLTPDSNNTPYIYSLRIVTPFTDKCARKSYSLGFVIQNNIYIYNMHMENYK